jgi:hypothetical protein
VNARIEVGEFLSGLNQVEATGRWELAHGQERVSGLGPVRVLARSRPQGQSLETDAHQLLERIRRYDQCDNEGEKLFRVMLIDVGSSEVLFSGLFFKEELVCNGLPPGSP